jgi:hypothetical protein
MICFIRSTSHVFVMFSCKSVRGWVLQAWQATRVAVQLRSPELSAPQALAGNMGKPMVWDAPNVDKDIWMRMIL